MNHLPGRIFALGFRVVQFLSVSLALRLMRRQLKERWKYSAGARRSTARFLATEPSAAGRRRFTPICGPVRASVKDAILSIIWEVGLLDAEGPEVCQSLCNFITGLRAVPVHDRRAVRAVVDEHEL